jgi:DNA helicase TIP49 (TBP-interacting protein)
MNKNLLTPFIGYFEKMSTPENIVIEGRPSKKRAVVTITTEDEQKAFFEVRDAVIQRIEKMGIRPGDQIEIGFVFIGSEKNGRTYNNLFINQIDYVK